MKYDDMYGMVGNTPHVRVRVPGFSRANIYVKFEGTNPTGSIKDRACLGLIHDKLGRGELDTSKTLLDASSGNMACAIAYYGRLMGYSATVVVNSKITTDKRNFIRFFGATIVQVGDFTIQGNQYCREQLVATEPLQYCFLDQLHNWANPRAYYESLGPELLRDFPDIAMLAGSLGSGGSLLGTAQYLKEYKPGIRIAAVQAASGTRLPGTGAFDDGDYITPFIQKGVEENIFDHIVKITEREAVERSRLLRDQGFFCGLQTGGVLHAALSAIDDLQVRGDVVLLSGDSGWKNMEKLLSI